VFGQDKAEQTFKKVIQEGFSTAPDFVVLTIKNLNSGQTKEIMTEVTTVYEALKNELNQINYEKIGDYLLNNSQTRTFEIKNKEALERLHFDKYQLKSADSIEKIILKESIIDSLSKINKQREIISEKYYEYSDQREEILEEIKDSIKATRQLTTEENKILGDLKDQYYDYHYNEYAQISEHGQQLMTIWNHKIKPFKEDYKKYTDELERLEKKFFRDHYLKFGLNFCHIAFKYGAIFNSNCENGMLEFNQVID
jgi:hypothetical protein